MDHRASTTPRRPVSNLQRFRAAALGSAAAGLAVLQLGCAGPGPAQTQSTVGPSGWGASVQRTVSGEPVSSRTYQTPIPVSHPPFDDVQVTWMQRLDQAYVYVDVYGSYAMTGSNIPMVVREAEAQGLVVSGPPFCLFYDDPGEVEASQLRARVCLPITGPTAPRTPLKYDVLPSRTIAQAFVTGRYPEVPRAYPAVLAYVNSIRKVVDGPILERYIVPPSTATAPSDLLCEIQVPFASAD